ncbi:hypothetical protein LXL04_017030 [Taraxacum kok-saghyz]
MRQQRTTMDSSASSSHDDLDLEMSHQIINPTVVFITLPPACYLQWLESSPACYLQWIWHIHGTVALFHSSSSLL